MSKTHEETWTTGEGALSGALYHGDTWIGSFTSPERARLAAEAPLLARTLLEHMKRHAHRTPRCGCNTCYDARVILKTVGVLP